MTWNAIIQSCLQISISCFKHLLGKHKKTRFLLKIGHTIKIIIYLDKMFKLLVVILCLIVMVECHLFGLLSPNSPNNSKKAKSQKNDQKSNFLVSLAGDEGISKAAMDQITEILGSDNNGSKVYIYIKFE